MLCCSMYLPASTRVFPELFVIVVIVVIICCVRKREPGTWRTPETKRGSHTQKNKSINLHVRNCWEWTKSPSTREGERERDTPTNMPALLLLLSAWTHNTHHNQYTLHTQSRLLCDGVVSRHHSLLSNPDVLQLNTWITSSTQSFEREKNSILLRYIFRLGQVSSSCQKC